MTANAETYRCENDIDTAQTTVTKVMKENHSEPETEEEAQAFAEAIVNAGDNEGNGFIFPDSDSTVVSAADAASLSDEDLRYAINEIYARHGMKG